MPKPTSDLDLLRPGVLLSEDFKLLERIPRWIADRRFLADHCGQRVQLLFFREESQNLDSWRNTLELLQALDHDCLLPVLSIESIKGYHFIVAREVRGPCLRSHLDEEGVLSPEDAKDLLAGARSAFRTLQQRGMECPAIAPEVILLVESDSEVHPVIFPWPLASFPATPSEEISPRLRDLLYTATTNLTAPATYSARDLLALPPPVRRQFQPLFEETPDWQALDDWSPSIVRTELPPERPEVRRNNKTEGKIPGPGVIRQQEFNKSVDSRSRGNSFNSWTVVSSIAAIVAAAAVVWFSYELVDSLRSPAATSSEFDDPQRFHDSFAAGGARKAGDGGTVVPELPRPATEPENAVAEQAADSPGASSAIPGELAAPPPDPAGAPGQNLSLWYQRWMAQRDSTDFTEQFSEYLRGLTPHADAMRSGKMPSQLTQLENIAKDGPPAASFLLGQILWGRETPRAEQIMIQIARDGYEPARAWCSEQFIEWE